MGRTNLELLDGELERGLLVRRLDPAKEGGGEPDYLPDRRRLPAGKLLRLRLAVPLGLGAIGRPFPGYISIGLLLAVVLAGVRRQKELASSELPTERVSATEPSRLGMKRHSDFRSPILDHGYLTALSGRCPRKTRKLRFLCALFQFG